MNADPFATSDAAYVLGALDDEERRTFEAHLASCASCAASVAALQGMPALLAAAPAEAFDDADVEEPPQTLLPRLLFEVRRERRRRVVRTALAAAAAVVIAAGGVGAYAAATSHSSSHGTAMTKLEAQAPIVGSARVVAQNGGSLVQIWCSYDASAYSSGEYELVIHSRSGQPPQTLSSWIGVPGKTIAISAPTTWPRSDIASVDILYGSETVLTLVPA